LCEDAARLEALMEEQGYFAAERIDYDLMSMDSAPRPEAFRAGPAGLVLRQPVPGDTEHLFALQAAYEQEEVLPANAAFDPANTRLNLDRILSKERVLVAELDGQLAGKINTSAESFTRYQIGGVYVRPAFRGLGIGTRMTAVFAQNLLALGRGLSLFVKQRNAAAGKIYRKAGFNTLADYRITYY
jgi:predicted GNAT family acetyltransferase